MELLASLQYQGKAPNDRCIIVLNRWRSWLRGRLEDWSRRNDESAELLERRFGGRDGRRRSAVGSHNWRRIGARVVPRRGHRRRARVCANEGRSGPTADELRATGGPTGEDRRRADRQSRRIFPYFPGEFGGDGGRRVV